MSILSEKKEVGAVGCKVNLPDGKLDYSCHRGLPTIWNTFSYWSGLSGIFPKIKMFSGYTATYLDYRESHEVDCISGTYLLIRKNVLEKIGWWDEDYFWNGEDRFIGKVIIFLFFFGAFVNITYHSWKLKPLIDGEEIEAIRSLQSIKGDFLAMSISSYYAPWIYGYSGMGTIAPGLFEYNKWDLEKWNRFWFTENPSVRRELLNEYDRTIYIFVGKKDPDIDFSHDNAFTQIHPHIWKFIPKKTL